MTASHALSQLSYSPISVSAQANRLFAGCQYLFYRGLSRRIVFGNVAGEGFPSMVGAILLTKYAGKPIKNVCNF
jgi:hypothetical protein